MNKLKKLTILNTLTGTYTLILHIKVVSKLKRLIAFFLIIFCLSSSYSQTSGIGRLKVEGEIKDDDLKPVSYAHILVTSRNEGWVGDYYGKFRVEVFPGDTLVISAVSFHRAVILIPDDIIDKEYIINVIMQDDTVNLKELIVRPWPATYKEFKKEFMEVEIDDPIANLDLYLPSPDEMRNLAYPQGGIVMPGPFSMLYDQFSKEARSKKTYAELIKKDRADKRYSKSLVSKITGLKNEDDIRKFMDYCAMNIKFILESTDYELYAAILNCYDEYCRAGFQPDKNGE
jgi:hypothetical protein